MLYVQMESLFAPVYLSGPPIKNATEALRRHSRRSQEVLELYSPSTLRLVRTLCPAPPHPRDHHALVVAGAGIELSSCNSCS